MTYYDQLKARWFELAIIVSFAAGCYVSFAFFMPIVMTPFRTNMADGYIQDGHGNWMPCTDIPEEYNRAHDS